jgi:hypothetical protein
MEQTSTLDETLKNFVNKTAKSSIAVVIPLFGFWKDANTPVDGEALKITLDRLYSNIHGMYLIFVAHPESLPTDPLDSLSVGNILAGRAKMGNTIFLPVKRDDSYAKYVMEGLDYAISETKAEFIMIFNPWTLVQQGSVDILVDRCNQGDDAKVISGFDIRSVIEPENFDNYTINIPKEEFDLSFNFLAMPRFVAEIMELDPNYTTHAFLQADFWQQVRQKNFVPIASQKILIFPFDFPWEDYEDRGQFEADREYFNNKWKFDPGLVYKDWSGKTRQDR